MPPREGGDLGKSNFPHPSTPGEKPASKMAGAETMSVEMMPTVVVIVVVSSDNELASVVWPVSAIVWAVIRSAVDAGVPLRSGYRPWPVKLSLPKNRLLGAG